ncbi:MAG: ATP-binding cassette domain-containing protein [Paracoccaceae bacterium]|nr:ATP-binding cassette domain-containing protein [Paracoccaceae bacterium]MDE2917733.1 ATP-binding cassette domain-containing protein [Paracoccaceae bacterium]
MMRQTEPNHLSLSRLATLHGEVVTTTSNQSLILDDPNMVWFIESGSVNLFMVEIRNGVEQSHRQYIMHCEAGLILPGIIADQNQKSEGTKITVIAKRIGGAVLRKIPINHLKQAPPDEVASQIDKWILSFSTTLARFVTHMPRPTMLVEPGRVQNLEAGTISARKGVVWISEIPQDTSLYMGMVEGFDNFNSDLFESPMVPLTRVGWLSVLQNTPAFCKSTEEIIKQGLLQQALACFHFNAFNLEHLNRKLALVDDTNLERIRKTSRNTAKKVSRNQLYNIYDLPVDQDLNLDDSALFEALNVIGKFERITFQFPQRSGPYSESVNLTAIMDLSGIRSRSVQLINNVEWWKFDGSAILGFLKSNNQPVALIPGILGRYWIVDPVKKTKMRVTAKTVELLQADACVFYSPLPEKKVETADLLRISLYRSSGHLIQLILAGIPGGLFQVVPAMALGFTVSILTDDGVEEILYGVGMAIVIFGLIAALSHILHYKSLMSIKDRVTSRLEGAFWDRILRLPSKVLNSHPTSEIALSSMTFQHFRNDEKLPFIESLLSLIFMQPIFIYICFIDIYLGLVMMVLCGISFILTLLVGLFQIKPHGKVIRSTQIVSSRLFQIIEGIVKLRIERAEDSAYAIWARDYRKQKRAEIELGLFARHSRALGNSLPFLAGGVLCFVFTVNNSPNTGVGDFLMAYIVFLTFHSVTTRFGESMGFLGAGLKAMEPLKPMLDAETEVTFGRQPVEFLNGDVLFDRVSFRYDPDGPLILDDVTIHARTGEFVAIAGESGAGKSTLFNLALGFNLPLSGAIFYDGYDLRHLNLKQLRRKVGSVPQAIRLHPQDIWDNIAIHHEGSTTKMVWDAVRSARIEDQIKAMPMGLLTLLGTSGSVLSGGESQRITLARSLLGAPRVMLLDEATNWLDNTNQAEVMQNLALLASTRIVIAHRLSTLKKADRIYVLKGGKVVQTGSFAELCAIDGEFKDLITRQHT